MVLMLRYPLCKAAKFVPFDWQDAFNLNSQLTEEEQAVRDTAHQYCQQKLLPRVLNAARNEGQFWTS